MTLSWAQFYILVGLKLLKINIIIIMNSGIAKKT